ncbi:MAG: hypothetical protein P1U58_00175 [Verrucomicrobiales bacterium]|nr:hypothetical protein [Verrucomicrobiales bacterium]
MGVRFFHIICLVVPCLVSCQVKPYAPPPQKALVEAVEISVKEFAGRPEVYARVQGRLTSGAAQLVDSPQRREGRRIYLDVMEQTPRGSDLIIDLDHSPGFERIVPIDILGLSAGTYTLSVNGIETALEIPMPQAETVSSTEIPASSHLKNEMIAIEDMVLVDPVPSNP